MSNPWTEVYKDIREPFLQEKMAKKDYDGDGKIETGTQEYMGSRDKAIKKAMGKDPKKEMKKEELQRNLPQMKSGEKGFVPRKKGMKGGGLEKVPDMVRGMNKESMHSSNPAQQAAIAMAKKKREEDMMVDKKKKMKEEKYDNRYSDNTGEESKKKKAALEKKRGMKLDNHPQFKREMKEVQPPAQKLKTDRNMFQIPKSEQDAARERVLAKTKAKREKMAKEDVEDISELSKETMGSYVKKASKETRGNMMATQHGSGIPKKAKDIKLKQVNKRLKGMEMAGEKMAKEDVEPVIEEMEPFGLFMDMFVEQELEEEVMDDILEIIYEKCWKGYEKKGMKTMFGKRYPNCVKKEEVEEIDEAVYGGEKKPDNKGLITKADKTNNTLAYQNYMKKMKNKVTGEPRYKAADHMKDD